jgi:hypothetical protein
MKTFREFIKEVYDPDVVGKSQIRKQGEGGRVGRMRKQSEPEKRRMKAVGGGKMVPAKTYKDRKDIGTQRKTSDRQQQPTQARGSAALSPREQQAKARRERMAARGGATKVKSKDLKKQADKLLATKKKKTADPNYKPTKKTELTRAERVRLKRSGKRIIKDIQKGVDRPASAYDPYIKNFGKRTGTSYSDHGKPPLGRRSDK